MEEGKSRVGPLRVYPSKIILQASVALQETYFNALLCIRLGFLVIETRRLHAAPPNSAFLTGHPFNTFMPKTKSQVILGQELLRSYRGHARPNLTAKRANFEASPKLEFSPDLQVSFINRQRIGGATKWLSWIFKNFVFVKKN